MLILKCCKHCRNEFTCEKGARKYCSLQCAAAFRKEEITYKCKQCGNEFKDRGHGKVERIYCSRRCANIARPGPKRFIDKRSGYVICYPNGDRQLEHRLVMERVLGRKLHKDEHVHHKDGVRHNNNPNNLELIWKDRHFKGQRVVEKDIWSGMIPPYQIDAHLGFGS